MSNWEDDEDAYCTTASDWQDARRVCDTLEIPLHRASFAGEYRERVFAHFLREYAAGRTPNPDVLCNREIKFGVCLDYMHRLGAAKIATGHYARVTRADASPGGDAMPSGGASSGGGAVRLLKAADRAKDQSYFLHGVDPAALADTLFPLGELRKQEVRARAHAAGLSVCDKPDSTGICFIGERPFQEFLSRYLRTNAGPIEDAEGKTLGEHRGLALYTLGQRCGTRTRRPRRRRRGPVVRRGQGHRAQRADRRAGSRASAAHVRFVHRRGHALARRTGRRGNSSAR